MKVYIISSKVKGAHYTVGMDYQWQHIVHNDEDKAQKTKIRNEANEMLDVRYNEIELNLDEPLPF